jgi:hypothetical protein
MIVPKAEWDHLPDWQKQNVIWEWLETIDKSISRLDGNVQLLHERLRRLESAGESK